jgi:TolB-like protein
VNKPPFNKLNLSGTVFLDLILLFVLSSCSLLIDQKKATIAVWDFDDLSPTVFAQSDLGELLSGQVIETIQKKGAYTIVERERLLLALEELNIGSSEIVEESTRLQLGKISGAQYMVFGGYQVIENTMRLDMQLVEVETGKVQKAVEKTTSAANLSGWLRNAREAVGELLYNR